MVDYVIEPIEALWDYVEEGTGLLSEVNDIAKALLFWEEANENHYRESYFEPTHRNPENNYWMRNGTFALLILAAEGEL